MTSCYSSAHAQKCFELQESNKSKRVVFIEGHLLICRVRVECVGQQLSILNKRNKRNALSLDKTTEINREYKNSDQTKDHCVVYQKSGEVISFGIKPISPER